MRKTSTAVAAWLTLVLPAAAGPAGRPSITAQQVEFFETRVRPILVEHCYSCHGPKKQSSGLRLDSRSALLEGGDHGPVVVPAEPANSPLLKAIRHQGPLKMPPRGRLPPQAVEALTVWVTMGVPWPESKAATPGPRTDEAWKRHWAFQPVRKPALPPVHDETWSITSIDRFILARLEAKSLTPSPPASPRHFLRRLTFDLIGLPPTPEEVDAFEQAASRHLQSALEQVVDRLLASPHYGERWGRHWLDVARYADTKGYVFFQEATFPWAWTYRDYVIRAFNEDLPYDQFVLQQLAADQVPLGEDRRPLTALGFLTLGGRFMNNEHDIIDDRIDAVTRGLLGLTVGCARCHDHKYDPIPQKDYYALYGVFASCAEPAVPPLFQEPPRSAAYVAFARELRARDKNLRDFVQAKHAELVRGAQTRATEYLLAAHALRDQPSTEDYMLLADGSDLNPTMIRRWQAYLERTAREHHPVFAPWHALASAAPADFAKVAAGLSVRLVGTSDPARPVNPLVARAFAVAPPKTLAEAAKRYGDLLNDAEKLWRRDVPSTIRDPQWEDLWQVFHGPDAPPNVALLPYGDLSLLPDRPSQATLQKLRKELESWRDSGRLAPPRAMVLEDLPTPYEPRVFLRGNPSNLGEGVPRQFLQAVSGANRQPFKEGSGRLELARAIASPNNPLTARVLVNRVWAHHFGAGLVRTPSDFGLRSEPPSHPELLDYLAATFVENGWSLKKLHRLILLSSAYRQQSNERRECQAVDPENRLLWKANRQRLDFEAQRDALLAVAGRLDRTVGGPSVPNITAAGATRRTMYGFLDRLNVPGLYRTFDFPSPDATSPQRDHTTVPPQALFLMNNPFVIECSRALVGRQDGPAVKDLPAKVDRLYRLLYGRPPCAEEIDLAREFLAEQANNPVAWQRYGQALLIANEFVFVD